MSDLLEKEQSQALDFSPFSVKLGKNRLTVEEKSRLENIAKELRKTCMEIMFSSNYGHPASCLGLADFFTAMYFGGILKYNAENPTNEDRDKLIVSCGHISAILYTALAKAGFFPKSSLFEYASINSPLSGHPVCMKKLGIECSSGSLGQGVSIAVGMALGAKNKDRKVFLLTSDGEQQEGQVWEAFQSISKYNLTNLITFVDCNGIQNSGSTEAVMPMKELYQRYLSFGFRVIEIDGNNIQDIISATKEASSYNKPTVFLMHTISGKGVSFMEKKYEWHGDIPEGEEMLLAKKELGIIK